MPLLASTANRAVKQIALALLALTLALPCLAAEPAEVVVLVAKPELQDSLYRASILIARALPDGGHVGFILNKPTTVTIATAFPDHAAAQPDHELLYLGGPVATEAVFGLVQTHDSPGAGSMQIAPDLFLVIAEATLNRVIEKQSGQARLFLGTVVWQPGELASEMKRGAWYVLDARPDLVMPANTEGLWERLVRSAELYAKAI